MAKQLPLTHARASQFRTGTLETSIARPFENDDDNIDGLGPYGAASEYAPEEGLGKNQ